MHHKVACDKPEMEASAAHAFCRGFEGERAPLLTWLPVVCTTPCADSAGRYMPALLPQWLNAIFSECLNVPISFLV